MKNKLKHDIIVYRKEEFPDSLDGKVNKFLSTSVTKKGVLGGEANVAVIVPQGTQGSYIETLSEYKNQREYLINKGGNLSEIYKVDNKRVYISKDEKNE